MFLFIKMDTPTTTPRRYQTSKPVFTFVKPSFSKLGLIGSCVCRETFKDSQRHSFQNLLLAANTSTILLNNFSISIWKGRNMKFSQNIKYNREYETYISLLPTRGKTEGINKEKEAVE